MSVSFTTLEDRLAIMLFVATFVVAIPCGLLLLHRSRDEVELELGLQRLPMAVVVVGKRYIGQGSFDAISCGCLRWSSWL